MILLTASLGVAAFTLPGCVFSVGGGGRPVVVTPAPEPGRQLTDQERAQVELAEAYAGQISTSLQRDGLVKVASMPDLTPVARRRVIQLARGMISSSARNDVLNAIADNPGPVAEPAPPAAEAPEDAGAV